MPRLIHISDTHGFHRKINIPYGDILIHSGDITRRGELETINDFSNWLKELPFARKIIIFGNHELGHSQMGPKRKKSLEMIKESGAIYLEDSGIEIDGLKIYGSPVQPEYHRWEWNRRRGRDIKHHWDMIPDDTNILITHGPPNGILDAVPRHNDYTGEYIENVGCKDLLNRINELKQLKLHLFGHIHEGYSVKPIEINSVRFSNASICQPYPHKNFNEPVIINY
jgi:predicted phosphodiesterase